MKHFLFFTCFLSSIAIAEMSAKHEALAAKNAGEYETALVLFEKMLFDESLQQEKNDAELWFQYGLVLRFTGRHADALAAQDRAREIAPQDMDIRLEIARLHFYLGDRLSAEQHLNEVIAVAPDYPGLTELQRQLHAVTADPRPWTLTLGHEWSQIKKRGDHWQLNLLQISRVLRPDFSLQLNLEHAERSGNTDYYVSAGGYYRLSSDANIALGAGHGMDAEYLAGKRFWIYADWRAARLSEGLTSLWFTVDASYSNYDATHVLVTKPGVRVDVGDRFSWAAQAIVVDDAHASAGSGWATRVSLAVVEPLRVFAGYSDAPETEESITLDTRAVYAGLQWRYSPHLAIAVSAATEKRERAFVRDIVNASISVWF